MEGEWIKYDRDALGSAINLAIKAKTSVSDVNLSSITGLTTKSNPSIATELEGAASDIETQIDNMSNLESSLLAMDKAIKDEIELDKGIYSSLKDTYGDIEEIGEYYRVRVEEKNKPVVEGYLYFPKNMKSDGLPLITYLSGNGGNKTFGEINDSTLAKLLSNQTVGDAVIFIPKNIWSNDARYNSNKDISIYKAICRIVDENNLDKDRVSLIGHSVGGYEGFRLVAYANAQSEDSLKFSTLVTTGAATNINGDMAGEIKRLSRLEDKGFKLKGSNTIFINYRENSNDDLQHYLYGQGLQSVGYNFSTEYKPNGNVKGDNAHNFIGDNIFSSPLFEDLIGIRYGTKLSEDMLMQDSISITPFEIGSDSSMRNDRYNYYPDLEEPGEFYYRRISGVIDDDD